MVNWKQSLGQTTWVANTREYGEVSIYGPPSTTILPVEGFATSHDVSSGNLSVLISTRIVIGIPLSSQYIVGAIDGSSDGALDGLDDREDDGLNDGEDDGLENGADDGMDDGEVVVDGTDDGGNVFDGDIEVEG